MPCSTEAYANSSKQEVRLPDPRCVSPPATLAVTSRSFFNADAVRTWSCTMRSVDEMAAVARGEDPDVSLFGLESPRSRYVAAERARAAEVCLDVARDHFFLHRSLEGK